LTEGLDNLTRADARGIGAIQLYQPVVRCHTNLFADAARLHVQHARGTGPLHPANCERRTDHYPIVQNLCVRIARNVDIDQGPHVP